MKFLTLYLAAYFLLLLGAAWVLWQSRILSQIPAIWVVIGSGIAVGFGVLLAVASSRRVVTRE